MQPEQKTITHIRNHNDLNLAVEQLVKFDPGLKPIVEALPEIPLRHRPPGFEGMAEIITAQLVSKASASAIFGRMRNLIDSFDAETFLKAGAEPLIEAGQSRAKQATLTSLAKAIVEDGLDLEALCKVPAEQAMAELTALKGIGPWSAEVFLLFCAGHTDIFPAGDIALQHAVGDIKSLAEKPNQKQTRELADKWAPHRGAAARVCYAHYARLRGRSAL